MSHEDEADSKLVLRAESKAQALELREPDWDAFEQRVTESLASAPGADDALFLAPLPESEEERHSRLGAEPAGTVSLADLARATVAKRAGNEAANMAKESLALASQQRAKVERSSELKPSAAARPVVAVVAAEAEPAKAPAARSGTWDSRGPWIGVAIATVGLAASFGLYFAGQQRTNTMIAQPAVTSAPVAPVAADPKLAEVAQPKPSESGNGAGAEPAVPGAEAVATLDPRAIQPLPPNAPEAAAKTERSAPAKPSAGSGKAAAAERVVLDEDRPAPTTPTAAKPALRPAEMKPEGISDRPSTGAAQAAVGAVLGSARACLAGQTASSTATLVFGSDGEVDSVRVAGAAAGTPAASCVESALKKARVQPFAAPSFSLGVTVRPL